MNSAADFLVSLPENRKGRFGESVCENVLRTSGMTYIPLCRIEMGGSPKAVSQQSKVTLPDYDLVGGGVTAYLDAKVKTQSVRYRNSGQVRHGIDTAKYQQYVSMGVMQNKQCGLFLIELLDESRNWSGTIMSESFAGLGKPEAGFSNQSHMVYWPRDRFAIVGSYSPEELLGISKGEVDVSMDGLLKTAFSAPPPRCSSHNDPSLWIDQPGVDGRGYIRTVCKKCQSWIGSRPASNSSQVEKVKDF